MVLLLTDQEVSSLLTMDEAISSIESAFLAHSNDNVVMPPRLQMKVPGMKGDIRIMPAALPENKSIGFKFIAGAAGKRVAGETYFLVTLFDPDDAKVIAIMGGNYLTGLRTGAASGVATKYLARKDVESVGIFGTGFQVTAQLEALCKVRDIRKGFAYDIMTDRCKDFCNKMNEKLGIELVPAENPSIASNADVIITSTTSNTPFLMGDWLKDGSHINSMGANAPTKKEVDISAFKKSKIVVDFKEQALSEAGDLIDSISSGSITSNDIHAELGEIITGKKPGRENDQEITLFKSVGIAIEDIITAGQIYQKALDQGIGQNIKI